MSIFLYRVICLAAKLRKQRPSRQDVVLSDHLTLSLSRYNGLIKMTPLSLYSPPPPIHFYLNI